MRFCFYEHSTALRKRSHFLILALLARVSFFSSDFFAKLPSLVDFTYYNMVFGNVWPHSWRVKLS